MSRSTEQDIVSFLHRLEPLGPLLQSVAGDDMQVLVEIRPHGRRILIDLCARPVRVREDAVPSEFAVGMAGTAADLSAAFQGRLGIMRGVGERRLLLRGGMSRLVRMFPVLELLPALYGDHLLDGGPGADPAGGNGAPHWRWLQAALGVAGRSLGARLADLDRRELLAVLTSLARGVARACPRAHVAEDAGPLEPRPVGRAHLLARPGPAASRRRRLQLLHRALGGLGAALGLARYRLGVPLDLFAVLEELSDGLAQSGGSAID